MKKRILLSLILGILFTICPNSYGAVLLDRIVAIVNNDIITWSEPGVPLRWRREWSWRDLRVKRKRKGYRK
jgi:hypothetical protein